MCVPSLIVDADPEALKNHSRRNCSLSASELKLDRLDPANHTPLDPLVFRLHFTLNHSLEDVSYSAQHLHRNAETLYAESGLLITSLMVSALSQPI